MLILLDDVGFGAAGTFGGPVQTPQIDQLAARGLRYNNFRVCAQCSPTRAALLTGRNDHSVGFGTVGYGPTPGYDWMWPKSCVSIADVLRRNGFSTAAFGKWHNTPTWETNPVGPFDRWPTGLGFEYFYGFMTGMNDEWEPALYRNTTPVEPPATPEQGYYLTNDLANDAIAWIQTHQSLAPDKPYFLYFATGATHEPQQVPKEWIDKYRGQFDQGWDKLARGNLRPPEATGGYSRQCGTDGAHEGTARVEFVFRRRAKISCSPDGGLCRIPGRDRPRSGALAGGGPQWSRRR